MNHLVTESDLLRRLVISLWGACWGVLFATAAAAGQIATSGDTHDAAHPSILSSEAMKTYVVIPWQERYERNWYALTCVCGALGGWAAVRFVRVNPWLASVAVVAFVPFASEANAAVFGAGFSVVELLVCGAVLGVPLLLPGSAAVPAAPSTQRDSTAGERKRAGQIEAAQRAALPGANASRLWLIAVLLCIPLVAILVALLAPYHLPTVASACYEENHIGSYLVGPAQYHRAADVVPALDFESHYGLGHAYAFSRVMGSGGLERTLQRYVLFGFIVTALYFLSAHLVLTDWLRNPWAAFAVTLLLVAAAFEGADYLYPSNWPVRHPFVFAFLFCAVRGVDGAKWCLAAGAVAGLSLFWQTDTGLYTLAAGVALRGANAVFLAGRWWQPIVFLAAALGTFAGLCLTLFGPRVLSVTFAERLLEPLLLYATGFGNQLLNWEPGWGWWYNLAGPGLAIASVGVFLGCGRRGAPREVVYAAAASLLGLAMLFKWVNRSIDVLWALNGGLVLAVAGWWACVAWRSLSEKLGSPTRRAVAGVTLLGLVAVGVYVDRQAANPEYQGGSSSPLVRIAHRLDIFPNPINALRHGLEPDVRLPPVDAESVGYLRDHTGKTERVALICPSDWNYLAAVGRAPRLYWLQLFLVHSPILLDRCAEDLRNSDRVFVARDALITLGQVNPAARDRVVAILAESFDPPEPTPSRWEVYHRKPGAVSGRTR